MKLFAGSSNQQLAEDITRTMQFQKGETQLDSFPNDELKVRVGEAGSRAVLLQSFSRPVNSHMIEYMLLADALRREGVTDLVSIIPWYGYSKQDKVFLPGEPLSAKVVAKLIQLTGTTRVITFDLHNPSITGYFDIPVINIPALPLFIDYILHEHMQSNSDVMVVAPDAGAIKNATKAAQQLDVEIAYINKTRDLKTGEVAVVDIDRSIEGRTCVIFDDMIATGSTMIKTAEFLKSKGAKQIAVCATHHLYIPGVQERLDESPIDLLVVTNTIRQPQDLIAKNLRVLSVAKLLPDHLHL